MLVVEITAHPEHADGGLDTHEFCLEGMHDRIEGTHAVLERKYVLPPGSDLETFDTGTTIYKNESLPDSPVWERLEQ